jgi:hypothetical protein
LTTPAITTAALVQSPAYDYSATTGLSLPQLQQTYLHQAALMPQMPFSVYNPTYLVTQSNGLFTQHQNQLQQMNKPVAAMPVQPVIDQGFIGGIPAAPGQIVFNSYAYNEPVRNLTVNGLNSICKISLYLISIRQPALVKCSPRLRTR